MFAAKQAGHDKKVVNRNISNIPVEFQEAPTLIYLICWLIYDIQRREKFSETETGHLALSQLSNFELST